MKEQTGKLDYLVIGHVTQDIIGDGKVLGGTAAYSSLCARNLGLRTGILTASKSQFFEKDLDNIIVFLKDSPATTTFENKETDQGRKQILHQVAAKISINDVPDAINAPKIVHIGPVADEVDRSLIDAFPGAFLALTPQGWMRKRDENNIIQYKPWEDAKVYLNNADAVVLSIEDVNGDQKIIDQFASETKVLALTEGYRGAIVYWNGDMRHFSAPRVSVVDATGAGDIFSTVFFSAYYRNRNPWESARQAVAVATDSVKRVGIKGVPTTKQVQSLQIEILQGN